MAREAARERFQPQELRSVLERYDHGPIRALREYPRGRPEAPKAIIETGRGRFLLKRRPPRAAADDRIAAAHEVIRRLALRGVPTPAPVATREGATWTRVGPHAYELFPYVEGRDDDHSPRDAQRSGEVLRAFGAAFSDGAEPIEGLPHGGAYADSDLVREHIAQAVERTGLDLREDYESACRAAAGVESEPLVPVHGDWHPGNLIYDRENGSVLGLVDFDTARIGRTIDDAAVGALQAALRPMGGTLRAPDNSMRLDADRFLAFCRGYGVAGTPAAGVLPGLIGAALIAEAVGPVASHGRIAAKRPAIHDDPTADREWLRGVAGSIEPIRTQSERLLERLGRYIP